jgi:hypothetical protein
MPSVFSFVCCENDVKLILPYILYSPAVREFLLSTNMIKKAFLSTGSGDIETMIQVVPYNLLLVGPVARFEFIAVFQNIWLEKLFAANQTSYHAVG